MATALASPRAPVENGTDAATRLTAAAFSLALSHPYLGAALWAVPRIPCAGLGTVAVDTRWRLFYDPAIVAKWTVAEATGVLYHEILHLLRNHADRGRITQDPRLWNLAADAEINDDLVGERIVLPGSPVLPDLFGKPDGLTAEEYFASFPRSRHFATLVRPGASSGNGAPTSGVPTGGDPFPRCGPGATGHDENWLAVAVATVSEIGGDDPTHPGLLSGAAQVIRKTVATAIEDHAKGIGRVPGHLTAWAKEFAEPKVDWRAELASLVRHAFADAMGASDYRYRRPSRRQATFPDIVLPSLRQPVPNVAVVVDTSGSMWGRDLDAALAEINGILLATGTNRQCTVLSVDAQVQACRRVFRADQVVVRGGGGTDMGRGIEGASRLNPRPDVVIVLTDGHTPWPETPPPGMRVVVGLVGAYGTTRSAVPAWATSIVIHN
jgi:predicted metal-dependent peptidase